MESPWHEEQEIREYVRLETEDEIVEHAEKVSSLVVLDERYDVWDVHTDKGRWWVISNLTNLYHQTDFRSMDEALSFHIGLMARLSERSSRLDDTSQRLIVPVRQWEQAAKSQGEAREAQEFQAVAAQCREVLLSIVEKLGSDTMIPAGQVAPRRGDFIHWAERIADAIASGSSEAKLRSYLKSISRETWEYVSHITHKRDAVRADGRFSVRFTGHVLETFAVAFRKAEADLPDTCPVCGSYRIATHWERVESGEDLNLRICEVCDWQEEFEPRRLDAP